jgi:hypothetical protein
VKNKGVSKIKVFVSASADQSVSPKRNGRCFITERGEKYDYHFVFLLPIADV